MLEAMEGEVMIAPDLDRFITEPHAVPSPAHVDDAELIDLHWLDPAGIRWAQQLVTTHHYLHKPVDTRCSIRGYGVHVDREIAGVLLFGRPQCTVNRPFFGGLENLATGIVECSYWEVLNLPRVYLLPAFQAGGDMHRPERLPGYFVDRRGIWRSSLASTVLGLAARRVVVEYLLARPPCFLEEPYQLRYLMSYQAPQHRGVIYRESGFERWRENADGVVTWRLPLRPLTPGEDALVRERSATDPRARALRSRRAAKERQLGLV